MPTFRAMLSLELEELEMAASLRGQDPLVEKHIVAGHNHLKKGDLQGALSSLVSGVLEMGRYMGRVDEAQ